MTRKELQNLTTKNLSSKQAADDARQILMIACGISHEELVSHGNKSVNMFELFRVRRLAAKRNKNFPMAYLSGIRSFFGRYFFVNKDVLIPRPETEIIIEESIKLSDAYKDIIEIGTGSGAITVTLAAELHRPIIATDISKAALVVAKKNAKNHKVENLIEFVQSDLLDATRSRITNNESCLIIANLPYLSNEMLKTSPKEVTAHEPILALQSDTKDGLDLYRKLFNQLQTTNYKLLTLLLEFDPRQKGIITDVAQNIWPDAHIEVINDLVNKARVLRIDINPPL
jgi:release factor glutamine methyltransferase